MDTKRILIRIPLNLAEELTITAKAKGISVNALIIEVISNSDIKPQSDIIERVHSDIINPPKKNMSVHATNCKCLMCNPK